MGTIGGMAVSPPRTLSPARRRAALALAAVLCATATAAPAPWFYWRSKIDGKRVCAQVSPGEGWVQDSEPYEAPNCQPRKRVYVVPVR